MLASIAIFLDRFKYVVLPYKVLRLQQPLTGADRIEPKQNQREATVLAIRAGALSAQHSADLVGVVKFSDVTLPRNGSQRAGRALHRQ